MPESYRRRRAQKACVGCHSRKLRCDFDAQNGSCKRCQESNIVCEERITRKQSKLAIRPEVGRARSRSHFLPNVTRSEEGPGNFPGSNINSLKHSLLTAGDALHVFSDKRNKSQTENENGGALRVEDTMIVKDGVLPAEMVPILVEFFFEEVARFGIPRIPAEYRTPALYKETFLLAVICTLGARHREDTYYSNMHRKLWAYCDMTLSKVMWQCQTIESGSGCSGTRGLIFGLLLLSEWIPGAFFLENEEQDHSPVDIVKKYIIRSWLYVGHALKLAQCSGLIGRDKLLYIQIQTAENALACQLGITPTFDGITDRQTFPDIYSNLTFKEKSLIDLLKLFRMANNAIYKSRAFTSHVCRTGEYIVKLQMFLELFRKWENEYRNGLSVDYDDGIDIMFEYNYCKLYIFSISIAPYTNVSVDGSIHLEETEMFLNCALEAARSVIKRITSVDPVHNTPLRWTLRLIHAVMFLAKSFVSEPLILYREENADIFSKIQEYGRMLDRTSVPRYERYSKMLGSFCCKLSDYHEMLQFELPYSETAQRAVPAEPRKSTASTGTPSRPCLPPSLEELFSNEMVDFSDIWPDSMSGIAAAFSDG